MPCWPGPPWSEYLPASRCADPEAAFAPTRLRARHRARPAPADPRHVPPPGPAPHRAASARRAGDKPRRTDRAPPPRPACAACLRTGGDAGVRAEHSPVDPRSSAGARSACRPRTPRAAPRCRSRRGTRRRPLRAPRAAPGSCRSPRCRRSPAHRPRTPSAGVRAGKDRRWRGAGARARFPHRGRPTRPSRRDRATRRAAPCRGRCGSAHPRPAPRETPTIRRARTCSAAPVPAHVPLTAAVAKHAPAACRHPDPGTANHPRDAAGGGESRLRMYTRGKPRSVRRSISS